jgi:cytochrome c oxidase subunit 4
MAEDYIVPMKTYFFVFLCLLVFTLATTLLAYVPMGGKINLVVALTIAIAKATLVVLFFMHVKYSQSVIRVVLIAGLFWFALLMGLTLSDYLSRATVPVLSHFHP